MSFLAGRLAASEGAFFKETSKAAIKALKQNLEKTTGAGHEAKGVLESGAASPSRATDLNADVLPEVLRHSVPVVVTRAELAASAVEPSPSSTSLAAVACRTAERSGELPHGAAQQSFFSVPNTALGPRKWEIDSQTVNVVPSTANAARSDTSEALPPKESVEGFLTIAKAFIVATALVFGGGTLAMGWIASSLDLKSSEDVRSKGKELMQPRIQSLHQQFEPLKIWAQQATKAHMEDSRANRS